MDTPHSIILIEFMEKYGLSLNDMVEITGLAKGTLFNIKSGKDVSLKTHVKFVNSLKNYEYTEGQSISNPDIIRENIETYNEVNYTRLKLNKMLSNSKIKRKTYTYNSIPISNKDRKMIKGMFEFIISYLENKYVEDEDIDDFDDEFKY